MTEKEVIRHIDAGADYYVSLFGDAEHMETIHHEHYSYVMPKQGEHGISMVYCVRLENLSLEKQKQIIEEIKSLHMPVWFPLTASDELFFLFFGADRVHEQTQFADDDEVYLAMLPDEKPISQENDGIVRVCTAEEFAVWAKINNDSLAGGNPDMHPVYHYPLCLSGKMRCYIIYAEKVPVAVCAIMDQQGIASLEFVATVPEKRRKGYAGAVCARAIQDAFVDGAKIITVRAVNGAARKLYQSLGFKVYNHVL